MFGNYLETISIPLLRGRRFTAEDRLDSQPVMIISQNLAQQLWPHQDPMGKRILRADAKTPWRTVVGVVGDVPDSDLASEPLPHCYSPFLQKTDAFISDNVGEKLRNLHLTVRT